MPVIALTQEMGSLSKDVADGLVDRLQLSTLRHEVAEHVAAKMHVSKSLITRLREGKAGTFERLRADREGMAVYTAEEVLEAAARGNVVLRGWGATCLLRPVPHAVCVRVTRPLAKRVEWLMDQLESDDAGFATAEIHRSDAAHAARMHEQFGVSWGDPLLYDLVVNTDRVSVDSAVDLICALLARPEFAETPASRAQLQDMALQARVRSALRLHESTHGVNVTIDSAAGQVILRGIVVNTAEREQAEAVARAVPGVLALDNQLHVMAGSKLFTSAKY